VQVGPFVIIFGGNEVGGFAWVGEHLLLGRQGIP
jgi:hypothetical protein